MWWKKKALFCSIFPIKIFHASFSLHNKKIKKNLFMSCHLKVAVFVFMVPVRQWHQRQRLVPCVYRLVPWRHWRSDDCIGDVFWRGPSLASFCPLAWQPIYIWIFELNCVITKTKSNLNKQIRMFSYLGRLTLDFTGTSQTAVHFTTDQANVHVDCGLIWNIVIAQHLLVVHGLTIEKQVHLGHIGNVELLSDGKLDETKREKVSF